MSDVGAATRDVSEAFHELKVAARPQCANFEELSGLLEKIKHVKGISGQLFSTKPVGPLLTSWLRETANRRANAARITKLVQAVQKIQK